LIRERDVLAGEVAAIGGDDEEMQAVEVAGAGEDAIPLAGRLGGDLADDEIGKGIDALAGTAAEQGFRAEVELEFDKGVGGDGDEQEIGEEPEEDLRGKRERAHGERENSNFEFHHYSRSGSMRR
jgi:hypothetical protein